ncbi:hypothetical protein FISHEDRAFT_74109 [Fistulina hepatica ATCC 64428]|uniref:Uncharacterized protein n=1 Tax=Fistulina hepatica ATCC 64428 TaxID=1128425 RepID=A0A0D7AAX9_9AGAR|nr:hypothetical protein FISHEDRAFT_74109 [Fistulina hepatica ATCC 64428]
MAVDEHMPEQPSELVKRYTTYSPFSCTDARQVMWQCAEYSFRWELLCLDRALAPGEWQDVEKGAARDVSVRRCFPASADETGDYFMPATLPSSNGGLWADKLEDRAPFLRVLAELMSTWKAVKFVSFQRQDPQTGERWGEYEYAIAEAYIGFFFSTFGRAPVVPHHLHSPAFQTFVTLGSKMTHIYHTSSGQGRWDLAIAIRGSLTQGCGACDRFRGSLASLPTTIMSGKSKRRHRKTTNKIIHPEWGDPEYWKKRKMPTRRDIQLTNLCGAPVGTSTSSSLPFVNHPPITEFEYYPVPAGVTYWGEFHVGNQRYFQLERPIIEEDSSSEEDAAGEDDDAPPIDGGTPPGDATTDWDAPEVEAVTEIRLTAGKRWSEKRAAVVNTWTNEALPRAVDAYMTAMRTTSFGRSQPERKSYLCICRIISCY